MATDMGKETPMLVAEQSPKDISDAPKATGGEVQGEGAHPSIDVDDKLEDEATFLTKVVQIRLSLEGAGPVYTWRRVLSFRKLELQLLDDTLGACDDEITEKVAIVDLEKADDYREVTIASWKQALEWAEKEVAGWRSHIAS
uniref:Uncharacterized protein n=1 Tax=Oryza punctata TaxID=4537 RepID=A0A0E0KNG6_ORYPU